MNLINAKLYGILDAQSFKKIFPQEYFNKFATHLKILQFQKNIFASPPQPGKLLFTKRQKTNFDEKTLSVKPKTIVSKFAKINDTIQNDRQEINRFKTINKIVQNNMNNPQLQYKLLKNNHPNEIKTFVNQQQISMTVIDKMLIESTRQTNQKFKQKLQNIKKTQVVCKFIKRDPEKQGRNSYKSKLQWTSMKRYNSQKKINYLQQNTSKKLHQNNLHLKNYENIHRSITNRTQSISLLKVPNQCFNQTLQTRSRSGSIRGLNGIQTRSKSSKRNIKKLVNSQRNPMKIDWINQTKKIKDSTNLFKNLKFSEQIMNQPWKKIISQIQSDKINPQNKYNQLANTNK